MANGKHESIVHCTLMYYNVFSVFCSYCFTYHFVDFLSTRRFITIYRYIGSYQSVRQNPGSTTRGMVIVRYSLYTVVILCCLIWNGKGPFKKFTLQPDHNILSHAVIL